MQGVGGDPNPNPNPNPNPSPSPRPCKAWEEKLAPHQTPWCYVADSCPLVRVRV